MLLALYLHFAEAGWAPLCQVAVPEPGTVAADGTWTGRTRRLDMLCTRPSSVPALGPLERLAVEVKVTRQDFRLDVANPGKQAAAHWLAHRHTYAVPAGLVAVGEVPAESGLLYVHEAMAGPRAVTVLDWQREAPVTPVGSDSDLAWLTLLYARRAADAEARMNGFTFTAQSYGDNPADLHAAIEILRGELFAVQRKLARQEGESVA